MKMLDITAPDAVQVEVREDGKVLWVNVDGECVLRACRIGQLEIVHQNEPELDKNCREITYFHGIRLQCSGIHPLAEVHTAIDSTREHVVRVEWRPFVMHCPNCGGARMDKPRLIADRNEFVRCAHGFHESTRA